MWKPYLKVVAKKAGHALPILDRFHNALHPSGTGGTIPSRWPADGVRHGPVPGRPQPGSFDGSSIMAAS